MDLNQLTPPPTLHPSTQDMNLRELTKRYGRGIGLSINAVSAVAEEVLLWLVVGGTCWHAHVGSREGSRVGGRAWQQ